MNVFSIKRRNIFVLFAILLILIFFYLCISINQIEQEEFNINYNKERKLKEKIHDLNDKIIKNKENLEKLYDIESKKVDKSYGKSLNLEPDHFNDPHEKNAPIKKNSQEDDIKNEDLVHAIENNKAENSNSLLHPVENKNKLIRRLPKVQKPIKIYLNQCEWFQEQTEMNTDIQTADLLTKIDFEDVNGGVWKQGFDIHYKEDQWSKDNKLHIFVIPHSHNDPGWLMTFEEYFHQRTRSILDTIVNTLSQKRTRKFIWAETSYLSLWWGQASNAMKEKLRKLIVETKQLEIVTGGWVMTDEANSYYLAMIEEMVEGHEWLKANIDSSIRPTYGWSIDPFGYTPTMAYLLKQMGFDSMLIQRVHYSIKKYMGQTNRFEFDWTQSWSTSNSKDTGLFCHVMPFYSYDVPHTCGPDPKICCQYDFPRMSKYGGCPWGIKPKKINQNNVQERAFTLLDQYRKKAQLYGGKDNHNVLLVPLGDDFRYRDMSEANDQFENYELLMDFMNSKPEWNVEIKWGTLKDYFELLSIKNSQNNHQVETFSGDFFTYADRENHYWSGYYTSRPFSKRLDRVVEYYLRSAEIVFSFANLLQHKIEKPFSQAKSLYKKLLIARRNLGLFQHHDGITGTSKTPVVNDYTDKLYKCLLNSKLVIENSVSYLSSQDNLDEKVFELDDVRVKEHKDAKKVQFIDLSEIEEKTLVLYNSNINERNEVVSFKVNTPFVEVINSDGQVLQSAQISALWSNIEGVDPTELSSERMGTTSNLKFAFEFDTKNFELLFQVKLAPLSLNKFIIRKSEKSKLIETFPDVTYFHEHHKPSKIEELREKILKDMHDQSKLIGEKINFDALAHDHSTMISVKSGDNEAYFSQENGFLDRIVTKSGQSVKSKIKFVKYGTTMKKEKSGAYLFLPDGPAVDIDFKTYIKWIRVENNAKLRNRVCVHMTLLIHCVEFFPTLDKAKDLETPLMHIWNVVDIRQTHNYELVMHIETDINNDNIFHTDLNGFQYTKRKNYRKLTIQGNVYPMPSGAFIQDSTMRMNVLTGQSLGVASQDSSSLQVFLDRRLDQDDNRGMEQAMNDNLITSSKFLILFEAMNNKKLDGSIGLNHPTLLSQTLSFDLVNPIVKLVHSSNSEGSTIKPNVNLSTGKAFPCDLRLVNMRTMQTENEEPSENEVGLIFHRIAHEECPNSAVAPSIYIKKQCSASKDMTFLDYFDIFSINTTTKFLKDLKISSSFLTLQEKVHDDTTSIDRNDLILSHIQPMQIEAFKVYL